MAHVNIKIKHGKKSKKMKKRKIKKKIKKNNVFCFLCLISNTLPQLEPSSLQPSTLLHHRHLLHTTCYNHLLLLLLLLLNSREENGNRNRLRTPFSRGLRSQKGIRPFNTLHHILPALHAALVSSSIAGPISRSRRFKVVSVGGGISKLHANRSTSLKVILAWTVPAVALVFTSKTTPYILAMWDFLVSILLTLPQLHRIHNTLPNPDLCSLAVVLKSCTPHTPQRYIYLNYVQ